MNNVLPSLSRTPSDVAAEVVMTRTAFAGAIVLVEGPSDSRFLNRHLDQGCTQITICGGKHTALGAIDILRSTTLSGYVAIIDRDFDDHIGINRGPIIFVTDTHDVETLMLSKRITTLLQELGDSQKISSFQNTHQCTISDALLTRCEHFAKIRYLNEVTPRFACDLTGFSPWKYTDVSLWQVDLSRLWGDFSTLVGRQPADLTVLLGSVPSLNSWIGVRGHDAMAFLSIALRQVLGASKQVSENYLASSLRLSFTEADFASTALYRDLKIWETSTGGLNILAN